MAAEIVGPYRAGFRRWSRWRRGILILALLLALASQTAAAPDAIKVFCGDQSPATQEVIHGLEQVLQRPLPVVTAAAGLRQAEAQAQQLAQEKLAVLVVLHTKTLKVVAPRIKKTPVVFAMVADPFQTGAAYDQARPEEHQENITGLASPPPLAEAQQQARRLLPHLSHWGLVYHPGEGPSVELFWRFQTLAQENGLQLTARPAATPEAAQAALADLRRQGVQIFFLPPDQFSSTYAPTLLAWGQQQAAVVVNGNPRLTTPGAVLRVTLDYAAVGQEAGRLVQRLLRGESPRQIPIATFSPPRLMVDEALLARWAGYPPSRQR
jgi:putative ABC transport system substrate-binding protein